jgi:ribosomal protein S14
MKLKKRVIKDISIRKNFFFKESRMRSLKVLIRLRCLNYLEVLNNLSILKNQASANKINNRCFITSRTNIINKKIGISRIKLRELVNSGLVLGFKKSSW